MVSLIVPKYLMVDVIIHHRTNVAPNGVVVCAYAYNGNNLPDGVNADKVIEFFGFLPNNSFELANSVAPDVGVNAGISDRHAELCRIIRKMTKEVGVSMPA